MITLSIGQLKALSKYFKLGGSEIVRKTIWSRRGDLYLITWSRVHFVPTALGPLYLFDK